MSTTSEKQSGCEPEWRSIIDMKYEQTTDESAEHHRNDGETAPADARFFAAGKARVRSDASQRQSQDGRRQVGNREFPRGSVLDTHPGREERNE